MPKLTPTQIVFVIAAVAVVYFVVTGTMQFISSHRLAQEESRLEATIDDLQEQYHRLSQLREYLDSDEFVEAAARQQLGMRQVGEVNIVAVSSPLADDTSEPTSEDLWWHLLLNQ